MYRRLIAIALLIIPATLAGAQQLQKESGKDFQISVDVQLPVSHFGIRGGAERSVGL